jgi:DNA-binding transcriptional LysR family regulator
VPIDGDRPPRQPAITVPTRAIAALKSELGIRLFQRIMRPMALTEAGELYL